MTNTKSLLPLLFVKKNRYAESIFSAADSPRCNPVIRGARAENPRKHQHRKRTKRGNYNVFKALEPAHNSELIDGRFLDKNARFNKTDTIGESRAGSRLDARSSWLRCLCVPNRQIHLIMFIFACSSVRYCQLDIVNIMTTKEG